MTPDGQPTWAPGELEEVGRCPMCGSRDRTILYGDLTDRWLDTVGRWTLRRCGGCASVYLDPRPGADVIGRAYVEYYTHSASDSFGGAWAGLRHRLRNGYLNATLGYRLAPAAPFARCVTLPLRARRRKAYLLVTDLPYRGQGARLLDLGCGNGDFVAWMNQVGWSAEGVDPDPRAVSAARSRGLVVHQGTLESIGLEDETYDAITMRHVFEHLPTPVETFRVCRRLLRPGGYLWIATPNLAGVGHDLFGVDWVGLDAPRHLVLPSAKALDEALDACGFDRSWRQSTGASWFYAESGRWRDERLGIPSSWARRIRRAARARLTDLAAARRPEHGEELVVLARARATGERLAGPERRERRAEQP